MSAASPPHSSVAPSSATPYASLTPAAVLDALAAVGQLGDGRLLQLNSYENRVFQAHLEDGTVVVAKFYRDGRWTDAQILEEHAFAHELVQAEVPVVAPLVLALAAQDPGSDSGHPAAASAPAWLSGDPATLAHFLPASSTPQGGDLPDDWADRLPTGPALRYGVTPRAGGRAPELEDPQVLTRIGRFLARLHAVGAQRPFVERTTLGVAATGRSARDWLVEHEVIAATHAQAWRAAADQALDLAQAAFDRVDGLRIIRLHGDCHTGNVLWTETGPSPGPHFVDLDDACNGPAVQDLWMLLSGEPAQRQQQLGALLDGYESMVDFDDRELQLIEPLRTLRLIHHSAWLARRWADPAFPAAFPWFASAAYWSQQTQTLHEQIEQMQQLAQRAPLGW